MMIRRDLKEYFARGREPWAANYMVDNKCRLPTDIKDSLAVGLAAGHFKAADIHNVYGIRRTVISKLVARKALGFSLNDRAGRPADFSPKVQQILTDEIKMKKDYQERVDHFDDRILDVINDHREDNGRLPKNSISPEGKRKLYYKLRKEHGIRKKHGDCGTVAREKAVASVLNALSFAAACNSFVPSLKCRDQATNADATTFEASGSKDCIEVFAAPKSEIGQVKVEVDPDAADENNLKFSVKKYVTSSGSGYVTKPIYIFADSRMGADEMIYYECKGLGQGQDVETVGYIVFCKSRACNKAFYHWWLKDIYIPWVAQLRQLNGLGADDAIFHSEDGELGQIEMFFEGIGNSNSELHQQLEDRVINIFKLCASSTEIQQALDHSNTFRSTKNVLRHINEDEIGNYDGLLGRIVDILKFHNEHSQWSGTCSAPLRMKPWFVRVASKGLLRVWYACGRTNDVKHTSKGFVNIGMFHKRCKKTLRISFDAILNNIKRRSTDLPITGTIRKQLLEKLPACTTYIRRNGELDDAHILRILGWGEDHPYYEASHNHLVVHRRRCVFLTNRYWLQEQFQKKIDAEEAVAAAAISKAQLTKTKALKKQKAKEQKAAKEAVKEAAKQEQRTAKATKQDANAILKNRIKELELINAELQSQAAKRPNVVPIVVEEPPRKKQKLIVEVVETSIDDAMQRATEVRESFRLFVANPINKRKCHMSRYCACVICHTKQSLIPIDDDDLMRCLVNTQHKHLSKACWMTKNACALCSPQ